MANAEPAVSVTVSTPSGNDAAGSITASGQVEAVQTANISTRVMGYITAITVKTGDAVKAGQLLVRINSTDIQAKRAQADALITQAQAAVESAKKITTALLFCTTNKVQRQKSSTMLRCNSTAPKQILKRPNKCATKQMRNSPIQI